MASGEKAVKVAFRNNLVIFLFKLFAALTTRSAGIMAEAVQHIFIKPAPVLARKEG